MVTSAISFVSLSPLQDVIDNQSPLPIPSQVTPQLNVDKGPSFHPPGALKSDQIQCYNPAMVGREPCSTPTDRQCWLQRALDGKQYDINANYEDDAPIGTTRQHSLGLLDAFYDADGMEFDEVKLFNKTYPGPWIEACWRDT